MSGAPESETPNPKEAQLPEIARLPEPPPAPDLRPILPPRPSQNAPKGLMEPDGYGKAALASTAASAFIMPVILLSLGGYWLDTRLKNATYWWAGAGALLGMVVGVASLIKLLQRLSDEPKDKR